MKTRVQEVTKNALSLHFGVLTRLRVLPALPVPRQSSLPIKVVVPEFQAEQVKARIEAEKERARREQKLRMQQRRAERRATFSVD